MFSQIKVPIIITRINLFSKYPLILLRKYKELVRTPTLRTVKCKLKKLSLKTKIKGCSKKKTLSTLMDFFSSVILHDKVIRIVHNYVFIICTYMQIQNF